MPGDKLLKPRAEKTSRRAEKSEVVSTVVKVASVDLGRTEIFEVVKVRKLGGNLAGSEEEQEGFSGEFDAVDQRIVGELFEPRQSGSGLTIVKDKTAIRGPASNVAHSRTEGLEREIGDDTEPCKEGGGAGIKAGIDELLRKGLMFEVYGDKCEVAWDRNSAGLEKFAFPALRRRVVDLKHTDAWMRIAIGKGIETRSEENVLGDTLGDGDREHVFGITATGDEKGTKR